MLISAGLQLTDEVKEHSGPDLQISGPGSHSLRRHSELAGGSAVIYDRQMNCQDPKTQSGLQ